MCIAFSVSKPFRKPAFTNPFFTVYFIFATVASFYFVLFNEAEWTNEILEMFVIPEDFRYKMLMIIFGDFIATYLFENVVVRFLSDFEQRRQTRLKNESMKDKISKAKILLNDFNQPENFEHHSLVH